MGLSIDRSVIARLDELNDGSAPDIVVQLVVVFLEVTPKRLLELQAAIVGGDFEAIFQVSHSMKSGSASLGLVELTRFASEIELAARERNPAALPSLLQELMQSWRRASTELASLMEERAK